MTAIDVEAILAERSPDQPSGEDLEYDAEYLEVLQQAQGTPDQVMGDSVQAGREPNWKAVKTGAVSLLARTHDLNLVLLLNAALLRTDGLPGLRDGLRLLKGLLEQRWDSFYPQLDPDDDNDPLLRMNLLASVAAPLGKDGDSFAFQKGLREATLCSSRQVGTFSTRDIMIATGELAPPAGMDSPPDMALIEAAFNDSDPEELLATSAAAAEASTLFTEIDRWVTEKVGHGQAPDLSPFSTAIDSIRTRLHAQLERRGLAGADDAPAEGADAGSSTESAGGGTAAAPAPISGEIRSQQDVLIAMSKIQEYYRRNEPSSPVPILLARAERLVNLNFIDIMKDMAPDGLSALKVIAGVESFSDEGGEQAQSWS